LLTGEQPQLVHAEQPEEQQDHDAWPAHQTQPHGQFIFYFQELLHLFLSSLSC